jgi:hypothetical protein
MMVWIAYKGSHLLSVVLDRAWFRQELSASCLRHGFSWV